jgi:adenylate cyclase
MSSDLPDELLDDVEGHDRDDRERLVRWLEERGVSMAELREAKEENRLALLPTEHLLNRGRRLSLEDAAAQSGLRREFIERVWRVAGIPVPEDDEPVIDAEDDLEAMRLAKLALDAGMSEDTYIEISRVVGRASDAIARAMIEQTTADFLEPGDTEVEYAMRIEEFAEAVVPVMPSLVAFPIRQHLRDALRSQVVERSEGVVAGLGGTRSMAIGFADLVGYSSRTQEAEISESSRLAGKLEALASSVAQPPVRLVKLIGDEAMFVSDEIEPLVSALIDLRERATAEEDFPELHLGVAVGEVVSRAGDVYGPAVNVASRLTSASNPAQCLAHPDVAKHLVGKFELRELDATELKGIGEVRPVELIGLKAAGLSE